MDINWTAAWEMVGEPALVLFALGAIVALGFKVAAKLRIFRKQ